MSSSEETISKSSWSSGKRCCPALVLREFRESQAPKDYIRDYERLEVGSDQRNYEARIRFVRKFLEKRRLEWTRTQMTKHLAGGNALPATSSRGGKAKGKTKANAKDGPTGGKGGKSGKSKQAKGKGQDRTGRKLPLPPCARAGLGGSCRRVGRQRKPNPTE